MKFKDKLFIMSLILITLSVSIIGFILIKDNLKKDLKIEISQTNMQINSIYNNIQLYGEKFINLISPEYKDFKIEIYNDSNLIYTNSMTDNIKDELEKNMINKENNINIYISNNNLYMALNKSSFLIIIQKDITQIYNEYNSQMQFFLEIVIIFSIIISFILSFFITILTRKISILENKAIEVSKGNYDVSISIRGSDELSSLASTFNNMIKSIHNNIEEKDKILSNRQEFINNLTHEIRTPLTSIIGFSSLIRSGKIFNNKTIIEYANNIYEEGLYIKNISDRLTQLILLDQVDKKLTINNISKYVIEIISDFENLFPNTIIESEIEKDIFLPCDFTLLKSLLSNLVKNAIMSYSKNEKKTIRIILNLCSLQVVDKGKGIPQEEIDKIKDTFYTLNNDRNREISGLGLGLPFCIKIAQYHNWILEINSKLGEGTTVIIFFKGENNDKT